VVAIVGVRLSTDVSGAALKSHPRPVPAALRIPHASTSSSLRRPLALAPFALAPFTHGVSPFLGRIVRAAPWPNVRAGPVHVWQSQWRVGRALAFALADRLLRDDSGRFARLQFGGVERF